MFHFTGFSLAAFARPPARPRPPFCGAFSPEGGRAAGFEASGRGYRRHAAFFDICT